MRHFPRLFAAFLAFGTSAVSADNTPDQLIREKLTAVRPDLHITSMAPAPFQDFQRAKLETGQVLYISNDAKYVVAGELFELGAELRKWEDPALRAQRLAMYKALRAEDAIVNKPSGTSKAVVYAFVDADCGFCQKMDEQLRAYADNGATLPGYLDHGIEIRYLAFPRAGLATPSARKLESFWCGQHAKGKPQLLHMGGEIPPMSCTNPVASQFDMGLKLGLTGTPTLWLPNGELKAGYVPPAALAKMLGITEH